MKLYYWKQFVKSSKRKMLKSELQSRSNATKHFMAVIYEGL